MIPRIVTLCFSLLALVGCNRAPQQQQEYFPYTDAGVLKPRVAIASVTDTSGRKVSWDVAEEIVHGIRYFLHKDGEIFVVPQAEVYSNMALLGDVDLFGMNLSPWKSFCKADYVVLIDIFESNEVPLEKDKFYPLFPTSGNHSGNVLAMKLRLKVIDVSAPQPKLVLFEVLESNHQLPFGYETVKSGEIPWGHQDYCHTPSGMIHNRLIYQLTERINTVLCDA